VLATIIVQEAPESTVPQPFCTEKSAVVLTELTWSVEVPVLVSTTVCAADTSPTVVGSKVRAPSDNEKEARAELPPEPGALVDVPSRSRTFGLVCASLSTVIDPRSGTGAPVLDVPVALPSGEYTTIAEHELPGVSSPPQVVVEKKGGCVTTLRTVTFSMPVFVKLNTWEAPWPSAVDPKLKTLLTIRPPLMVSVPLPSPKPSA
jgi:hypothetical protein